ncbi:MAG: hypothetical protein JSS29_14680 [Proteobacteria bacterium]|nr:hypothetical protein [Pseudomonadota bacterium]
MSSPKTVNPSVPTPAADAAGSSSPAARDEPTGRVTHDERGNAVWEWFKNSTSRLLRKLEAPELKTDLRRRGGGYDPYNQGRISKTPRK